VERVGEEEYRKRGYSAGDKEKARFFPTFNLGGLRTKKSGNSLDNSNSDTSDPQTASMTAGSSILKNFSWPLKTKKRHRSGSGGSKEFERKKKILSVNQQRKLSGRKSLSDDSSSSLEIVAPTTSDVEFKYSWPIDGFIQQVKTCKSDGMDSKTFEINVNGVLTMWNLSVRFWVGEQGEKLANPFVLCLNLLGCKVEKKQDVAVKYKFGIYNRTSEEYEMGAPDKVSIKLEEKEGLQSIGYKNIAISDKHVNSSGDVILLVRLSIIKKEEPTNSLSADLGSLINDEKSSDLILQAGERKFRVHRNILAARSPVFADLLAQLEDEIKENVDCQDVDNITAIKEEDSWDPELKSDKEEITNSTVLQGGEAGESVIVEEVLNNTVKLKDIKEQDCVGAAGRDPKEEKEGKPLKKLVITDLPSDTVEELLRYIYTDSSNNVDLFSQTLLAASDRYQLPGLKLHCEKHLGEILNPLNVAEILLLSDSYKCQNLKRTALSYCNENHSYIMKDSRWKIIEEENPDLFEEAIAEIAPETCSKHAECLKSGGNRYETEKENSKKKSLLKKYQ